MRSILSFALGAALCAAATGLQAQTITLDQHFNHEMRKNVKGEAERFHYLWEEKDDAGFSILGDAFKAHGFKLASLDAAPTAANLAASNVYLIVDPDSKKESPSPNYIEPIHVTAIANWVKKGGVLVMLANDSANVELPHFNTLAAAFGMHFTNDRTNHVSDDAHFENGAVNTRNNPVFKTASKIFMKDACDITTTGAAKPVLKNAAGATLIAMARHGKGTAIAIADPWLYNEYTNGRLPAGYENDKAAQDLAAWIKTLIKK